MDDEKPIITLQIGDRTVPANRKGFAELLEYVYRMTDPETSRQPFNKEKLQAVALRAIASHPGITAGEIGEITKVDGIWKRLPELERKGLILRGDSRLYLGTGRNQATWRVASRQLSFTETDWKAEFKDFPKWNGTLDLPDWWNRKHNTSGQ